MKIRGVLGLAFGAALVLSSCGVFPIYETHWFAIPGQVPRDKTIAHAICQPVAAGAKARAELRSNWPKDINGDYDMTYDPDVFDSRASAIRKGALTSCMAEQGWYPEQVCIANCGEE